ncbi:MAG: PilZ domain-containing protein [Desulfomonilaceae bacterium]
MMDDESSLINDIQGDLTDAEIMEKYQLSAAKLRRRLLQLMSDSAVSSADVYWRPILYDYDVSNGDKRATPRYPLALLLPVNEMGSPDATSGYLIDINEKGGCVKGISPSLGAKVALRIEPGPLISADEIILEVAFRWVERVGDSDFLAGFEILSISQRDSMLLRELIRTIVRTP